MQVKRPTARTAAIQSDIGCERHRQRCCISQTHSHSLKRSSLDKNINPFACMRSTVIDCHRGSSAPADAVVGGEKKSRKWNWSSSNVMRESKLCTSPSPIWWRGGMLVVGCCARTACIYICSAAVTTTSSVSLAPSAWLQFVDAPVHVCAVQFIRHSDDSVLSHFWGKWKSFGHWKLHRKVSWKHWAAIICGKFAAADIVSSALESNSSVRTRIPLSIYFDAQKQNFVALNILVAVNGGGHVASNKTSTADDHGSEWCMCDKLHE